MVTKLHKGINHCKLYYKQLVISNLNISKFKLFSLSLARAHARTHTHTHTYTHTHTHTHKQTNKQTNTQK